MAFRGSAEEPLKARTELEQQIWNECARLIANCIIFYNATILSNLLALKEEQGLLDEADLIKRVSPVAWQHINLRGRYRFRNQSHKLELDEIVANLSQYSFAKLKEVLVFN